MKKKSKKLARQYKKTFTDEEFEIYKNIALEYFKNLLEITDEVINIGSDPEMKSLILAHFGDPCTDIANIKKAQDVVRHEAERIRALKLPDRLRKKQNNHVKI